MLTLTNPLSKPRFESQLVGHGPTHADRQIAPILQEERRFAVEINQRKPSVHSATLIELADGRLLAAWFAGSREGARDATIDGAWFDGKSWSEPVTILDPDTLEQATGRMIRKVGNPVLFAESDDGIVRLFVVSALGGWATSSINEMTSRDGGKSWERPCRLITSPLANYSTLVRAPALQLRYWGIALPAYHELFTKYGLWLRFSPGGYFGIMSRMDGAISKCERIVDISRLPDYDGRATLQPAVVALTGTQALGLMRDAGSGPGSVQVAVSQDAGETWEARPALPIGNPNSSVALLRLDNDGLLLAGNPASGRDRLNLWYSQDDGRNWRFLHEVERSPDATAAGADEYSYPALLQSKDRTVHLLYTWRRQAIRHVTLKIPE